MTSPVDVEEQCAVAQSEEMELLRSMYSPDELVFARLSEDSESIQATSFTLRAAVDNKEVDVEFRMPSGYPCRERLEVFVRGKQNSALSNQINADLRCWMSEQPLGVPLVSDVVSWILENFSKYADYQLCAKTPAPAPQLTDEKYARLYILSHHLLSTIKRANIIQMAKELDLSGFSTPGRPAAIVVEGKSLACDEFWKTVKSWQWKRITLRHSELLPSSDDQRFVGFREIASTSSGSAASIVRHLLEEAHLDDKFSLLYNM
ncbi:hypothetical protein Q1695_013981 [Nippostrongylus brasiliensis]|nr:hypothetical protein Q1695_013981 [Nippostrongylus brasiliensis]